jgi:hypothetical protein
VGLRVGDWRVRLQLDFDARSIVVVRILPRGRAYDRASHSSLTGTWADSRYSS